jgi:hypothetical protein
VWWAQRSTIQKHTKFWPPTNNFTDKTPSSRTKK